MKTIINDCGNVEVITDAFKITIKDDEENISIEVLDFDMDRQHPWNIIQTQVIEKKREFSKDILTHVHEEINK